ncbi:MAG: hypothetical protein U5K79_22415 [Cyclobacteriaceae bacterium]|nr:hypothetical protein [Cyclobacteriaceae bacterium]
MANAGTDGNICGIGVANPFTFSGIASTGTGTWTQISGPGISTFSDNQDAVSDVTVNTSGTYVYRWTEVSGSCTDFDEVTVNFYSPLLVQAGNDQIVCNGTTVTLGNSPTAVGGDGNYTYSWTSIPAGFISSTSNPAATATATTTFQVTVSDGSVCADVSDDILLLLLTNYH